MEFHRGAGRAEGVGGREGAHQGAHAQQGASDRRAADRAGAALFDRYGRAGPCARRGSRQGLAGARRRRAGHRQIDADAADLQSALPLCQGPVCIRRGIAAPAQDARRAAQGREREPLCALGDLSRRRARMCQRGSAGHSDRGLHPDALQRGAGFARGQRQSGQGLHDDAHAARQGAGHHGVCDRSRQQGGLHCRSQGARAHGGLRALF